MELPTPRYTKMCTNVKEMTIKVGTKQEQQAATWPPAIWEAETTWTERLGLGWGFGVEVGRRGVGLGGANWSSQPIFFQGNPHPTEQICVGQTETASGPQVLVHCVSRSFQEKLPHSFQGSFFSDYRIVMLKPFLTRRAQWQMADCFFPWPRKWRRRASRGQRLRVGRQKPLASLLPFAYSLLQIPAFFRVFLGKPIGFPW